jgi:hypothetical protein
MKKLFVGAAVLAAMVVGAVAAQAGYRSCTTTCFGNTCTTTCY